MSKLPDSFDPLQRRYVFHYLDVYYQRNTFVLHNLGTCGRQFIHVFSAMIKHFTRILLNTFDIKTVS